MVLALLAMLSLAGCWKKSGEAIVLEKEHIAVAEVHETPAGQQSPTPGPQTGNEETETTREMRPNEIAVDGYVMDKDVRGTAKDPRATDQEQWIVRVKLIADGRRIDVRSEQAQFEKLKPGDRVHVRYREGKYTGTVWTSRID